MVNASRINPWTLVQMKDIIIIVGSMLLFHILILMGDTSFLSKS